jgi:hypothetical protein
MVMVKNSDYVGETKLRTDIHSDQNSKDKASTLNHLKHLQSTVTTNQCPISLFGYAVKSKGLSDVEVIERLNKLPYISFFFLFAVTIHDKGSTSREQRKVKVPFAFRLLGPSSLSMLVQT